MVDSTLDLHYFACVEKRKNKLLYIFMICSCQKLVCKLLILIR